MPVSDRDKAAAEFLRRLKAANDDVERRHNPDRKLTEELHEKREQLRTEEPFLESRSVESVASDFTLETIVRRTGRPVLQVFRDEPKLEFRDAESSVWRERLLRARPQLVRAIRAVGRVELENNPRFNWVGTGWLASPTILVTNRHVAAEFAVARGQSFVFRSGIAGLMHASADFIEEFGREDSLAFKLTKVLHIEPDSGADMAFFEIDPTSNGTPLAEPIRLAQRTERDRFVAVIGYPARDSRIPDLQLMEDIFGDVFDKKRLAPGQITTTDAQGVQHDCSTLGGNSGSVVLDIETGEAVALHFAGRFLEANFAVPAALLKARMDQIKTGVVAMPNDGAQPGSGTPQPAVAPATFTCTVPVTFTITMGSPSVGVPLTAPPAAVRPPALRPESDELFDTEAPPESYAGRTGFRRDFLGPSKPVDLPVIERGASEIVTFNADGRKQSELKYEHFSVIMHRSRRVCFFSACNIDGKQSKRTTRSGWKFDSRIARNLQIMQECYGDPPRFSRGHMTRREDPAWGSKANSNLGNQDSMHVTNAVPQMQSFNAGIWLSLEDHALQNAREDDMRISVMTGPFLHDNDPVQFGIKIPRTFWKVIAFIHDNTKELTATGYSISQEDHLSEQEFVFGGFQTYQRSLAWIERKAGISFGSLAERDPLARGEEAIPAALTALDQIRFV